MNFGTLVVAGCLAAASAEAGDYVSGMDFVVRHATTIDQIGAYDGGSAFTVDENVGIFNALTGNLVGPDVLFGPGLPGTQIGDTFYENVAPFVLQPGEYTILAVGGSSPNSGGSANGGLSDFDSYQNLGNNLDLPGGGRFNSGTDFTSPNSGSGFGFSPKGLFSEVDPVPDGGLTLVLLGSSLAGLSWLRRKI